MKIVSHWCDQASTGIDTTFKHAFKKLRNLRAMHNGFFPKSHARAPRARYVPVFFTAQLDNMKITCLAKPCSASQIYAVFARVFNSSRIAPATWSAIVNVINITTANVFIAKLVHLPFTINLRILQRLFAYTKRINSACIQISVKCNRFSNGRIIFFRYKFSFLT
jgi:hypothetical protein